MIFIKQQNLLKKIFIFLALFNLYISFKKIYLYYDGTYGYFSVFTSHSTKRANSHVYHNNTKMSVLTFIDHIKFCKNFVMQDPLNLFWYALLTPKMTQSRIRTHFFFGHNYWTTLTKFTWKNFFRKYFFPSFIVWNALLS